MRVAVAMSGGVDSLKTALLLRENGHEIVGVHMRILPASPGGRWRAESLIKAREEDLSQLALRFGIELIVVEMRESFEELVIRPFLESYLQGSTPNPCVYCNPAVKFGILGQKALSLGADRFSTGHYVRMLPPDESSDRFRLYKAHDLRKDQSYFLYGLSQDQLATAMFPLGGATKLDVIQWASQTDIARLIPEESQEICFIPAGAYSDFLLERFGLATESTSGPIVDMDGKELGRHKGVFAYTVGQRRGLGIASTAPYYVVEINPKTNTVRVGRNSDLLCREIEVEHLNWVSIPAPEDPLRAHARIRNQHKPAPAVITPLGSKQAIIRFDEPQRAAAPGQAAVFYEDDMLLGGGVIRRNIP